MSGHHSFEKLRQQVEADPERRRRVEELGEAYDALISLSRLRESCGITQTELAETLGVSQPNVSKLESKHDLHVSTLAAYVAALGGHLEVRAVLPDQSIEVILPDSGGLEPSSEG